MVLLVSGNDGNAGAINAIWVPAEGPTPFDPREGVFAGQPSLGAALLVGRHVRSVGAAPDHWEALNRRP
eukprot:5323925-Pyramimonas_sp.AAC.1